MTFHDSFFSMTFHDCGNPVNDIAVHKSTLLMHPQRYLPGAIQSISTRFKKNKNVYLWMCGGGLDSSIRQRAVGRQQQPRGCK